MYLFYKKVFILTFFVQRFIQSNFCCFLSFSIQKKEMEMKTFKMDQAAEALLTQDNWDKCKGT